MSCLCARLPDIPTTTQTLCTTDYSFILSILSFLFYVILEALCPRVFRLEPKLIMLSLLLPFPFFSQGLFLLHVCLELSPSVPDYTHQVMSRCISMGMGQPLLRSYKHRMRECVMNS